MKTLLILTTLILFNLAHANQDVEAEVSQVLKSYGLEKINAQFDLSEISKQQKLSNKQIAFSKALKLAIQSFITDDEDIEKEPAGQEGRFPAWGREIKPDRG